MVGRFARLLCKTACRARALGKRNHFPSPGDNVALSSRVSKAKDCDDIDAIYANMDKSNHVPARYLWIEFLLIVQVD